MLNDVRCLVLAAAVRVAYGLAVFAGSWRQIRARRFECKRALVVLLRKRDDG